MKIYKCYWYDDNPDARDNNKGLIYGIKWFDKNDNFIDIEWFSTPELRDKELEEMKKDLIRENWSRALTARRPV
jgi:hypothetical protein